MTNESAEVNGIWFYNSRDSEEFAKLLTRILDPYSKVHSKPQSRSTNSKFEELEKVPTMAIMDGPLEPVTATSAKADTVDDSAFVNFFSAAINIGNKPSTSVNRKDNYQAIPSTPSHVSSVGPSSISFQSQLIIYSPATLPLQGPVSTMRNSNSVTNLVKPSSFFQPLLTSPSLMTLTSSSGIVGLLNSPLNNSQLNSALAVLPFPPILQVSPASNSNTQSYRRDFDREKVRNALLLLAKENSLSTLSTKFYSMLTMTLFWTVRSSSFWSPCVYRTPLLVDSVVVYHVYICFRGSSVSSSWVDTVPLGHEYYGSRKRLGSWTSSLV